MTKIIIVCTNNLKINISMGLAAFFLTNRLVTEVQIHVIKLRKHRISHRYNTISHGQPPLYSLNMLN